MKIRALAPVAILMFAAILFLSATSNVRATVLITTGQCDSGDTTKCSASNAIITATAYIIKEVTPGSTDQGWANFQSAFNSWNASLAANNKWTLGTGNLSAEATLNVVLYRAYVQQGSPGCIADPHCGGAEIQVNYNNGGNPPFPIANENNIQPGDAVWAQSIVTNQKRNPSQPGNPYLDNAPGTPGANLGPPAYPFQYDGSGGSSASMLYDMPNRDDYAVWLADAFLSTADYQTRTLTVYDGLEWGFTVAAPLPATWTLMLTGLAGFGGVVAYRRKKQIGAGIAA